MDHEVFDRMPLRHESGIPIFSAPSEYTRNYERIAQDHLSSLQRDGTNPFLAEGLWLQCESSTAALIKKYSKPDATILDVGVGLGRLLSNFPHLRRYGLDITLDYLRIAQEKGIQVCYSLIEDMPYRQDVFDIIACTDVLEHVIDLNLCCSKMLSVLRPGGILVIRVPLDEDLSQYLASTNPYDFVHLRTFNESSLRLLFERVFRCQVVEVEPTGYWPSRGKFRYPLPIPKREAIVARLLSICSPAHSSTCRRILSWFYHPIEINVVVKKLGDLPRSDSRLQQCPT